MENTQIAAPDESYKISPEALEIAKTYMLNHDTKETALALGIEPEKVSYYLRKPDIKRFIDTVFLEQGYMNRGKIQEVMDELFKQKLEELRDAEMGTSKDILDLMALQHKMRMEEIKLSKEIAPAGATTKIEVKGPASFGANYDSLLGQLIQAGN